MSLYLLLIAVLQKLHVAAALTVRPAQSGAAMLSQQVRWWGHTAPLWIHPGVDMICDIATWDTAYRTHWHRELFAALQHLWERERETVTERRRGAISPACLLSDKRQRQLWECQDIHVKMLTFPLHMIKSSINTQAAHNKHSVEEATWKLTLTKLQAAHNFKAVKHYKKQLNKYMKAI